MEGRRGSGISIPATGLLQTNIYKILAEVPGVARLVLETLSNFEKKISIFENNFQPIRSSLLASHS